MLKSMEKKIWILSELYFPEESATGYYVTHVAEGLAREFSVQVLCAQPTYLARGIRAAAKEARNGVDIRRCWGTTFNKDILLFRLINLVTTTISICFNALMRIRRGDIMFVVTNPPTLPFLAAVVCRLRSATLILRIEDVYPEALSAGGILDKNGTIMRVLGALQGRLYKAADCIIVLGRDMQELVTRRIDGIQPRIVYISNWADLDEIVPLPRQDNRIIRELGLTEKFIIQYSGNMGRTHDIENIVECAKALHGNRSIHFLFIGWGAKEPWLRMTVDALALSNITVLPPQPRKDLVVSLNACDVAIVAFVQGMCGVSVPSRAYNNLAAGKLIIAATDPASDLAHLLEEEGLGWAVQPAAPDQLVNAIQDAFNKASLLPQMSSRARKIVEERFSKHRVQAQYAILFREIMGLQTGDHSNAN
jgi:glycosyltransferase involved in cell wall biosynthesis